MTTIEQVKLTPELAGDLLARNSHNRHISERQVARYARDMQAGNWLYNGDAIRISCTGVLLDGQHRLRAVIKSGVTVDALLVTGLPDEAQHTMDSGMTRSMGDVLALEKESNASGLAAILRLVTRYDMAGGWAGSNNVIPSKTEMAEYLERHPDVREAVNVGRKGSRELPITPTVFGALYHICRQIDPEDATVFFEMQVAGDDSVVPGDPAHALRRKLRGENSYTTADKIRYTIQAWNIYRDRRRVARLQAPPGGWDGKFPEPK